MGVEGVGGERGNRVRDGGRENERAWPKGGNM